MDDGFRLDTFRFQAYTSGCFPGVHHEQSPLPIRATGREQGGRIEKALFLFLTL